MINIFKQVEKIMKFVVLNYGVDLDCWDDGQNIGDMIKNLKETTPEKSAKILSTSLNSRWHESFTKNGEDWPHPNKVLISLSRIHPEIHIDWMPELNYLGIYVEDETVLDFLKDNYYDMLDTEAMI